MGASVRVAHFKERILGRGIATGSCRANPAGVGFGVKSLWKDRGEPTLGEVSDSGPTSGKAPDVRVLTVVLVARGPVIQGKGEGMFITSPRFINV